MHQQKAPSSLRRNTKLSVCPSCGQVWPAYMLHRDHDVKLCRLYLRAERKAKQLQEGRLF